MFFPIRTASDVIFFKYGVYYKLIVFCCNGVLVCNFYCFCGKSVCCFIRSSNKPIYGHVELVCNSPEYQDVWTAVFEVSGDRGKTDVKEIGCIGKVVAMAVHELPEAGLEIFPRTVFLDNFKPLVLHNKNSFRFFYNTLNLAWCQKIIAKMKNFFANAADNCLKARYNSIVARDFTGKW